LGPFYSGTQNPYLRSFVERRKQPPSSTQYVTEQEDGGGEARVTGCAPHATAAPAGRPVRGRPLRRSTCMFRGSERVQSLPQSLERRDSPRPGGGAPVRSKGGGEGDSSLSRASTTACAGAESFSRAATQDVGSMSGGELRYAGAPSGAARGASVCGACGAMRALRRRARVKRRAACCTCCADGRTATMCFVLDPASSRTSIPASTCQCSRAASSSRA